MSSSRKNEITPHAWKWVAFVVLFFFIHAVVRYNIIKGVPVIHIPLYIGNKILALSSITLLSLSYLLGPLARIVRFDDTLSSLRKYLGLAGYGLASMHAIASVVIFNPAYFAKWFLPDGKLSFMGELSLLFGIVSFFLFGIISIISIPSVAETLSKDQWTRVQRSGYFALALAGLHVFVVSYGGWMTPEAYAYGVIPLSLTAVVIVSLTLLARLLAALFPLRK